MNQTIIKDSIEDKARRLSRGRFPTGITLGDYDYEGYQNWTNKQWAWEFIRRKESYQYYCKQYKDKLQEKNSISIARLKVTFKRLFGLERHLYYSKPFNGADLVFSTEHLSQFVSSGNVETAPNHRLNLILMPGDMYIKFDLAIAAESKKNFNKIVNEAKANLQREANIFANNNSITESLMKHKMPLIDLIRLIDIRNANNKLPKAQRLKQAEIFTLIFPIQAGNHPGGFIKSNPDLQKLFSKKWKKAKDYMKREIFLDLAVTKD